jgi:hypothetical protein
MAPICHLPSAICQFSDGIDLGVGEACGAVVALGDDLAPLHEYGPDSRIGGCASKRTRSFRNGKTHETFVGFGIVPRFHEFIEFSRSRNGCIATAGLAIAETPITWEIQR